MSADAKRNCHGFGSLITSPCDSDCCQYTRPLLLSAFFLQWGRAALGDVLPAPLAGLSFPGGKHPRPGRLFGT